MDNRLFHGVDRVLMIIVVIVLCGVLAIGVDGCTHLFMFNYVETAKQRTKYLATHLLTGYPKTNEQLMEENGHFKQAKVRGREFINISESICDGLIIKTKDYEIYYTRDDTCNVITPDGTIYTFNDKMTKLESYGIRPDGSTGPSYASQKMVRKVKREWNARLDQIGHRMNFQFNFTPWMDFIW